MWKRIEYRNFQLFSNRPYEVCICGFSTFCRYFNFFGRFLRDRKISRLYVRKSELPLRMPDHFAANDNLACISTAVENATAILKLVNLPSAVSSYVIRDFTTFYPLLLFPILSLLHSSSDGKLSFRLPNQSTRLTKYFLKWKYIQLKNELFDLA
jgi:hypothetical protein